MIEVAIEYDRDEDRELNQLAIEQILKAYGWSIPKDHGTGIMRYTKKSPQGDLGQAMWDFSRATGIMVPSIPDLIVFQRGRRGHRISGAACLPYMFGTKIAWPRDGYPPYQPYREEDSSTCYIRRVTAEAAEWEEGK